MAGFALRICFVSCQKQQKSNGACSFLPLKHFFLMHNVEKGVGLDDVGVMFPEFSHTVVRILVTTETRDHSLLYCQCFLFVFIHLFILSGCLDKSVCQIPKL